MDLFAKSYIGLEIDAKEIRAVELKGKAYRPVLISSSRINIEPGTVVNGMVQNPRKLGDSLIKLWKMNKFKSRKVILGISNQAVIVRKADFPIIPREKLKSLIHYEAQNYLPLPLENVVLDYMIIGEFKGIERNKMEVLLVAAQVDMLNGFIEALEYARLKVHDIMVAPLSLSEIIPSDERQRTVIVMDISNELGSLLGLIEGVPRLVRIIRVNMYEANSLNPYEMLCNEIRSFIDYFLFQEKIHNIDKILLSGCGSRINGLGSTIEELLGINVKVLDPITGLHKLMVDKEVFMRQAVDFSACISLAIAGMRG